MLSSSGSFPPPSPSWGCRGLPLPSQGPTCVNQQRDPEARVEAVQYAGPHTQVGGHAAHTQGVHLPLSQPLCKAWEGDMEALCRRSWGLL